MRVYYDFEFLERAGHVDIISGGFVREDGHELYFVLDSFDTLAVAKNEWLMQNVMTSIPHREFTSHITGTGQPVKDLMLLDNDVTTRVGARMMLLEFTTDIDPEWWAWYGDYDHVALCSLFGSMVDLPEGWPMFTMDIRQLRKAAGDPVMPTQPFGKHNALDDARFNQVRFDFLVERLEAQKKITTWVIVDDQRRAQEWVDANPGTFQDVRVITHADQLRGPTMRATDVVVPLVPLTDEMKTNLAIMRRAL